MGAKSTKTKNIVTKFTLDGVEEDLEAAGGGGRNSRPQRPPSGMPNPREAERLKNFLSVPPAVYIDDVDSMSSMSAETTTTLRSSKSNSSSSNWTDIGARKLTSSSGSSNEELKCSTSLPNFVTSSSMLPKESRGAAADPTEMKLEDIEESPSQSSQGEGGASTPTNDTTPTMTKATKFFRRHREQNCTILSYSACD